MFLSPGALYPWSPRDLPRAKATMQYNLATAHTIRGEYEKALMHLSRVNAIHVDCTFNILFTLRYLLLWSFYGTKPLSGFSRRILKALHIPDNLIQYCIKPFLVSRRKSHLWCLYFFCRVLRQLVYRYPLKCIFWSCIWSWWKVGINSNNFVQKPLCRLTSAFDSTQTYRQTLTMTFLLGT